MLSELALSGLRRPWVALGSGMPMARIRLVIGKRERKWVPRLWQIGESTMADQRERHGR